MKSMQPTREMQRPIAVMYGAAVCLAACALYVKTLAPTVSFFDSGELIAAAATFGVAHPPGYPLYVLLGWLFAHLPVGAAAAYRINLMSAFFAALAALMAYCLTFLMLDDPCRPPAPSDAPDPEHMLRPAAAMIAGLAFACSLTAWRQAIIAEVYTLNAFLCGLIVALLLLWQRSQSAPPSTGDCPISATAAQPEKTPKIRRLWLLYLAAYLFGLGFGNHQTIILFSIPAAFLVIATTPRILLRPRPVALIFLCFALGLTIYGMVPLRAAAKPPINWGHATNWTQFEWLVLREGYRSVERGNALPALWNDLLGREPKQHDADESGDAPPAYRSTERGLARLWDVFVHSLFFKQLQTVTILRQFGAVGTILIGFGVCYGLWKRLIPTATLVIAILSFVLIVVFIGDPPDENIFLVEEFHAPVYLLCAALMGLGIMAAARGLLWLAAPFGRAWHYGVVFATAMTFLMIPAALMLGNLNIVDRSRNYVAYDYANNMFASLQPNAILFTWGDSGAFPLWYLQAVEGARPDVAVIHIPHLSLGWYREELPPELFRSAAPLPPIENEDDAYEYVMQIVEAQREKRPIYFDYSSVHSIEFPFQLLPNGITYKMQMPQDTLDEEVWTRYRFRGIGDKTRIAMDPDIERVITMYGAAHIELGQYYMEAGETEKAAQAFNNAVKFDPSLGQDIVNGLYFNNRLATEPTQ